ncbi:MAG: HD-GYP domain-containing protein [Candidatus Krumholzibacteriia bacterium]
MPHPIPCLPANDQVATVATRIQVPHDPVLSALHRWSKETAQHVHALAELAAHLGRLAAVPAAEIPLLARSARLHDIGKLGVSWNILQKAGPLTPGERAAMEEHTTIGWHLLSSRRRPGAQVAARVALEHHERWDGGGYPQGLWKDTTHLFSRITAICDVFDALSRTRVYRPAWSLQRIVDHLESNREKHFDPALLDLFIANIQDFLDIRHAIRQPVPAATSLTE